MMLRLRFGFFVCLFSFSALLAVPLLAQLPPAAVADEKIEQKEERKDTDDHPLHPLHEIDDALVRLPLAAVLGAALALRPRRKGTPPRSAQVVQTQIILAVVGAVIMLVVGASLARAFGIVGAANLIRYRSKIEDPKDAVVMLCALAVGLAAGVGLYALSAFSTVFLVVALGVIESFEPKTGKTFSLNIKLGDQTDERRPKVEAILDRHKLQYEIRTSSDEELCYDVNVPFEMQTEGVTNALLKLDPEGHAAVDWADKKKKA
ncbi:MAG: MgtC/SapB family protein [Vicinamibacterales bacterium]